MESKCETEPRKGEKKRKTGLMELPDGKYWYYPYILSTGPGNDIGSGNGSY